MNKEKLEKCRREYVKNKTMVVEEWNDKLWEEIFKTIGFFSSNKVVIQRIQLYKRRKKIWINIYPGFSAKKSLNIEPKEYDRNTNIPWNIEIIKKFRSELGDFFKISNEHRDYDLTLEISL